MPDIVEAITNIMQGHARTALEKAVAEYQRWFGEEWALLLQKHIVDRMEVKFCPLCGQAVEPEEVPNDPTVPV